MPNQPQGRRAFLKQVTALGTAAIPAAALFNGGCATQAPAQGSRSKTVYNPGAAFEIKVSETEYRRSSAGRVLLARIYAPQGAGPFPALLDLHGGAWNNKDRFANEPMDDTNKLLFAFAAYNAGPGRIHSLREAALKRGLDPNVWVNNVEMMAAEKIGMETVTYVANIYKYYVAYKLVAQQAEERKKAKESLENGP